MDDLVNFTENSEYEILTPDGWKDFKGVATYSEKEILEVKTEKNKTIKVSHNHLFCSKHDTFKAKESLGKNVETVDGSEKIVSVTQCEKEFVYDIVDVADTHTFYGNQIVNHNTHLMNEFWRSVYPIITSGKKSKVFICSTPNGTDNLFYNIFTGAEKEENGWAYDKVYYHEIPGRDDEWVRNTKRTIGSTEAWLQEFELHWLQSGESSIDEALFAEMKEKCTPPAILLKGGNYKIWKEPDPERLYAAGVDISEGVGLDASVIQIIDITSPKEIEQVACYHNNQIPPLEFTNELLNILKNWGNPLALIERNNCGAQVVDRLVFDIGYDKVVSYGAKTANRKNPQMGMIAHTNTKYKGVMNMRYFVNDMRCVQINDIETLKEFKNFVRYPNAIWKAKSGFHDDRVMAFIYALYILEKELAERFFEILELDEQGKPCSVRPLDFGVRMFEDPTSIYLDNEIVGANNRMITPMYFGGDYNEQVDEMSEMEADGWTIL